MNKINMKSEEDLELNQIVPIRKGLDGPVVKIKDWLTPLPAGTEFVVSPITLGKTYLNLYLFLDFYRKICNYNNCVFLIEEREGEEIPRYVIANHFCNKFELVEELYRNE